MRGDGPAPKEKPFRIEKADPALDAIIAPDAQLETIAEGFGLNEGPVWVRDGRSGYLLASGLLDNVVYKITPDREVSIFLEYTGYTGDSPESEGTPSRSGRQHVFLVGSGCGSLDAQGRFVWCAKNDHAIMRLEKDGARTLIVDNHDGKRFSGPNDLVIRSDGAIYFTDSDTGLRDGGNSALKELPNGVWLVKDGKTRSLLTKTLLGGMPNGIALSPDEKHLYLSAGRTLKRYEIRSDGSLGPASVFSEGDGIGDGIKVDRKGNVYSAGGAGPGIIRIMSAEGRLLGTLHLPIYGKEPKKQICATNMTFGDADGQSLYITACDPIYKIRLKAQGVMPGPPAT
jgi:gluconolactonase